MKGRARRARAIGIGIMLGASALAAASSCSDNRSTCTQGASVSCACTNGTTGAQICQADGTFGACACSAPDAATKDASPDATSTDGAAEADAIDSGDAQDAADGDGGVTQTGTIVDYSSHTGLAGATISSGSVQTTADSAGDYALAVTPNVAFTMTISASNYATLDEQEWMLSANANRGQTKLFTNATFNLLKSVLSPAPTTTLAVLNVQVQATGSCASATGTKLSVPNLSTDGGAGPHLDYFSGGFPSTSATSVTDGEIPSAIIWDLPLGTFSQITVTPPSGCSFKTFPVADPNVPNLVYTGNVKLEASQTTSSFMRVYLQ